MQLTTHSSTPKGRKAELAYSWPSWLIYSRRFPHLTGHSSDAGRARDRETSPSKDRSSTTVSRHNDVGGQDQRVKGQGHSVT